MSIPQELEDYINYQYGIIDALNHSLAHIFNDLTVSQGLLITSYRKLLSRVNPNTPTLRLSRDQEPAKYSGFDRAIRMRACSILNNAVYYTSYGNIIYVNADLSITVLGVPMVDETYGLRTIIPRHLREVYRLFDTAFADKCTMDIVMSCFMDIFIAANMSMPELYEIHDSFVDAVYDKGYANTNKYDLGYDAGTALVESIM